MKIDARLEKMCGNCCSMDHKFVDCPIQDLQFPLTKIKLQELRDVESRLDESIRVAKAEPTNGTEQDDIKRLTSMLLNYIKTGKKV